MKSFKWLIYIPLLTVFLIGCSDSHEETLKSITGKVTDSRTGKAVSSVSVKMGSKLTSTDANGMYTLTDLKSGQYTLIFEKEDYETYQTATTIMGKDVVIDCSLEFIGELNDKSISGKVTDAETGAAISSVTVSTGLLTTTTNASGMYTFNNLASKEYKLTFSKTDYITQELATTVSEQNVTLNCALVSNYSSATVAVDDFISISDGIYFYFKPSENVKKFYWSNYRNDLLPSTDNAIVEDLLSDGIESNGNGLYEGYSYNLAENTKYTVCVVALDTNNKRGKVVKKEISTKTKQNQPIATITINSISGSSINYSTVKNSYCSSYILNGYIDLTSTALSYPDIVWASYCYDDYKASENKFTQNRTNISWTGWSNSCIIFSLGFNSSGVNGGVISKQLFNAGGLKAASQAQDDYINALDRKEGKSSFDKRYIDSPRFP